MKTKTKIIIGIIILILGSLLLLSQQSSQNHQEINIGAALALSGDAAEWGEMSLKGTQLAIDELNQNGGINGKNIRLVVEDTNSTSLDSINATSKLINIDKVKAIVGPSWLDVYQGAGSLVDSSEVVMITPDSGTEALNDSQKLSNVYSTWYRVSPKAKLLAETAAQKGSQKMYVMIPNDPYYIHFADTLIGFAEEADIEIVGYTKFNDESNIRSEILRAKQFETDSIFFVSYNEKNFSEYTSIIKQVMPEVGMYGDEITKDFIDQGKYLAGLENVIYFHAVAPKSNFVNDCKKQYGIAPAFGASTSYDSVYMLAQSLSEKKDNETLSEYIDNNTFDTVSYGTVGFDEIGGVTTESQQYDLFQLQNGEVVTIN